MLNGIVSATAAPDYDPYAGAYLVLDFENSVYKINGTSVTAASVIDHTEFLTASGLRLDWNATTQATVAILPTAAAAIDFSVGCTVIIDMDQFDTPGTYLQTILQFWQGTPYGEAYDVVFSLYGSGTEMRPYCATSATSNRGVSLYHSLPDGPRKVGMTSTPDRCSGSLNGAAVVSDTSGTTGVTPVFDSYSIGGYPGDTFFDVNALYRSIIFYPPISDVNLPSYTL